MALVSLATRWGGVYLISLVPIGYRAKRFILAISGSVLVTLLAPVAVTGANAIPIALLTTAAAMLWLKRPMPANTAGVAATLLRQFHAG